ncbi:uncharacterized protein LOC116195846 isoform X3 [Punica granatum]|uniref:Uncharacterized protein LOC116195846 isoform X3 n=1 Tax=Punica granatum TaxID=22663 RepID=A0A6P8CF68_PUNGR|nr:uncharacterized protein LOC116195846 isoform X3 [Punica granatum]
MNAKLMAKSNKMKTLDRTPIDLKELGKLKLISENSADGLPNHPKILCLNEQQNSRSSFTRNQLVEPNYLQLHFVTMVSSPLVTGQKVEGEGGSPIHVFLVDPQTGFLVQDGALSRLELIVSVLEGDFNEEGETDWAQEYFQGNEITSISLVAGNLGVVLNAGMGTLGDITFNEESSMARNGTFRLGVKTSGDCCEGFRIREGISNAFVVKRIEATRWTDPAAHDMPLPDDWHSPGNLQELSSFPTTGNYNEIDDNWLLWSFDESGTVDWHHQQEYCFKSKQAATRWFKLKAVLQWAILRRIIMRKRARRMVVKSRVEKRLGQNWNVKEHKPAPVTSPTQMCFTCNHEHEDNEKDGKLKPINSCDRNTVPSKLDTSGMGQSLTLFPTLATGDGIKLKDGAEEVLNMAPKVSPIEATNQKGKEVLLERSGSFRSTVTDAGGSIPGKPDSNYVSHSLTLFPSLLKDMEPNKADVLEPIPTNSGSYIELTKLAPMAALGSGQQGYSGKTRQAKKRWRKLKSVSQLVFLWKVVAPRSFKEQYEATRMDHLAYEACPEKDSSPSHTLIRMQSPLEQFAHSLTRVKRENDSSKTADRQEDKHHDKSQQAAKRWRVLRALLWFTLQRRASKQSQAFLGGTKTQNQAEIDDRKMDSDSASTPLFSCGPDLAGLAVSSNLLHYSWDAISELRTNPSRHVGSSSVSVEYRESQVRNYRIIAFIVSPVMEKYLQEGSNLVPSSDIPDFSFLCSKSNPEFSINRAAKALFDSVRGELSSLKDRVMEVAKSTPYIVTGHSLGGSIASLFMLWLLNALKPTTTRRPLCITFGAPLLGDSRFQQAIYHYSTWNSCFLHTVHRDDPFPSIFLAMDYRPFGTFLFLSGSGKACFEAPDSILELLKRMKSETGGNQELQDIDYGLTIQSLRSNVVCKDVTELSRREIESYKAGIIAQLTSIGLLQNEDEASNSWVDKKIVKPEKAAITQKREMFDPARKLNDVKVNMAQLEWYKKTNENDGYAYYDSYKIKRLMWDHKVVEFKRILTDYWEKLVEEVEKKPQMEEVYLRKRWLYGGTNFRRMVEPLDIADYYKVKGRRDYWNRGRLNCYKKLEKWLKEAKKPDTSLNTRKQNIKLSMTEDSCFWAHVEEATIACEAYNNGDEGNFERLVEFETYVFGLIERYAVSPEIFLPDSTYMKWWKKYEGILTRRSARQPGLHNSKLVPFMKNSRYQEYKVGKYDPSEDDE